MSHVEKLHMQKYRHETPAVFKSSLKVSFFILANLLVLKSDVTNDRVFDSTVSTKSGISRTLSKTTLMSVLDMTRNNLMVRF